MNLHEQIPLSWHKVLQGEFSKPYWSALEQFLEYEYRLHRVYPPREEVFRALELTPYESVNVVIVGPEPYPTLRLAHGLALSVRPGAPFPPSLNIIFRELQDDLGIPRPQYGSLEGWAKQGVLLLNKVLTVRAGMPASHRGKGWEIFSDAVVVAVSERPDPVVFALWVEGAEHYDGLIAPHHFIHKAGLPRPYFAERSFLGSRPFSYGAT